MDLFPQFFLVHLIVYSYPLFSMRILHLALHLSGV